jgi:hypothetical protein
MVLLVQLRDVRHVRFGRRMAFSGRLVRLHHLVAQGQACGTCGLLRLPHAGECFIGILDTSVTHCLHLVLLIIVDGLGNALEVHNGVEVAGN